MLPDGTFLTDIEAADFLQRRGIQIKPKTLAKLRCVGGGPQFVYVGHRPRYTELLLEKWVSERVSEPHSIVPERFRQPQVQGGRRGRPSKATVSVDVPR